jgi:hypothetical protein
MPRIFRVPNSAGRVIRGDGVPPVLERLNAKDPYDSDEDSRVFKGDGVKTPGRVLKSNKVGGPPLGMTARARASQGASIPANNNVMRPFEGDGVQADRMAKANVKVPLSLQKKKGASNIRIKF